MYTELAAGRVPSAYLQVIFAYCYYKRGFYDIASDRRDPFPYYYYLEYLNNATVQEAIGTPVNYTQSNAYVYGAFDSSKSHITTIYSIILF